MKPVLAIAASLAAILVAVAVFSALIFGWPGSTENPDVDPEAHFALGKAASQDKPDERVRDVAKVASFDGCAIYTVTYADGEDVHYVAWREGETWQAHKAADQPGEGHDLQVPDRNACLALR